MNRKYLLPVPLIFGLLSACGATPTPTAPPPTAASASTVEPTATLVPPATITPAPTETPLPPPTVPPTETASPPQPTATPEVAAPDFNPDLNFAQVIFVQATRNDTGTWRFDVTVRHNDEGWDHYADLWQVLAPDGSVLGERILLHPHDTEQPFTRSQSGIPIPEGMTEVTVRAKCTVHGFGGQEIVVDLTAGEGENFAVER